MTPLVRLTNAFQAPFDNAIAAARLCYSSRVIETEEVGRDEKARDLRDRIARETYAAGHHTIFQHATFQFAIERVSRQLVWSMLHAHPFYNSEQVSQRYVEVKPDALHVPSLSPEHERRYRALAERMMACYTKLGELLTPNATAEYFRIFPARAKQPEKWLGTIKKKTQEIARYALPVATHTFLYHTVSGLTLHRYHRLCQSHDVPAEGRALVAAMVAAVDAHDPRFFREVEDPIPLEETLEHRLLDEHRIVAGGPHARRFLAEFDASLAGRRSSLIDWNVHAETTLATAVRSVLGLPRDALSDEEAIRAVLDPARNRYLSEQLVLTTHGKLTRALVHPHYTFRKKLSHAADSQDQRHRMVPGSRPVLLAQYAGGTPDLIEPDLIRLTPEAADLFHAEMAAVFEGIDALLSDGVPAEKALYLLPNAFPIRFEESGELIHLHHKWTSRLCYTAQEEIWRASLDEVAQVREHHPLIGRYLMPPCQLRHAAGTRPLCPEGPRFCGVPVWKVPLDRMARVL